MITTKILIENSKSVPCMICKTTLTGWDTCFIRLSPANNKAVRVSCCISCYDEVYACINTLKKKD